MLREHLEAVLPLPGGECQDVPEGVCQDGELYDPDPVRDGAEGDCPFAFREEELHGDGDVLVAVPHEHGHEDLDAALALAHVPVEVALPAPEAGHVGGGGHLHGYQDGVAEAVVVEPAEAPQPRLPALGLVDLADALAEVYVFSPGSCDWELAVGGALTNAYWLVTNATDADGGDTDLKAIQYVADWLSRNEMHFSETCEDDRLERYGATEQHRDGLGFDWLVINSALTEALNRGNYDRSKTLARMFDEGIVAAGTRGYVRQRRIGENSHRAYCVAIDNVALERFVAEHAPRLTGTPKGGWR